jgi:cyclohexadieny/prephenate dehydrogenase
MIFNKVCVIGLGLIGSSICRALRNYQPSTTVVGFDASQDVSVIARTLGFCDVVHNTLASAVTDADLVIIATPVSEISHVASKIVSYLKKGAILSDVGSVKGNQIDNVSGHLPNHVSYVPVHPMAGTEYSGPEAGFETLFHEKWCFVIDLDEGSHVAADQVSDLWMMLGSRTQRVTPSMHDNICALVSHVPHLIAFTMMGAARQIESAKGADMLVFSASGFRDFTRIAASDPTMWRDIFLENRGPMLDVLSTFENQLREIKSAISNGDADCIFDTLTVARHSRIALG